MTNYAKNYAITIYHEESTCNQVLFLSTANLYASFLASGKTDDTSKGYCILHQQVDIENIIN